MEAELKPCRLWPNARASSGYGVTWAEGKWALAHRVAYCKHHGLELSAIAGKVVRHTCDVRACVEPTHLQLGSHQDNMDDMVRRQRQHRGMAHHLRKLTPDDVNYIRTHHVKYSKEFGATALASRFGCTRTAIYLIVQGKNWKHIQQENA